MRLSLVAAWKRVRIALLFATVVAYVYRPWSMLTKLPKDTADSSFVTFTLAWVSHTLTRPRHLFDAPIYWPHHNTLAYSDPVLPLAPVWGAVHWVIGSWTASTGVLVLALVIANLGATYAVAKRLTGRTDAATLAALAFGLSDFGLAQWGHIQMQALAYVPLGFLLLFRLLDRGRWIDGLLLAILHGAMALTTASIAAAWAVAAATVVGVHVVSRRGRIGAPVWKALALAAVVSAAIVVPATRPYAHLQSDPMFRRPVQPFASFRWPDLLTPTRNRSGPLNALQVPAVRHHGAEHEAFPGVTTLALAGIGLVALAATRHRPKRRQQHELFLLVAAGAVCLLTAAGPGVLGPLSPYRLLHNDVPGFSGLRVATRFAMVTLLAIAVLAATGLATIAARLPDHWRPLTWAAIALLLAELAMPVRWQHLDTSQSTLAVYRALARRPAGAVAELPIAPYADGIVWAYTEAPREVYATVDWHPRFNGYSGFVAPGYLESMNLLNRFPDQCAIAEARRIGLRWLVLHTGVVDLAKQFDTAEAEARVAALPPGAVTRVGSSFLVDVTGLPESTC
ncbi:MAG: hypothetical protein JWO37_1295 [Acidimicrobiales bacterium]|nr:hypothetical protein [Acidimicrobiales bacterium]